jgi:DNA-binding LytR/AlgR family response regulator
MLIIVGIAIYFAGFIIEPPSHRWNISTFLDSCRIAFLIGIIPFAFCTLINYRYLFFTEIEQYYSQLNYQKTKIQNEELMHIFSQLKKEDLNFYPGQFIYCESDGNYVVFHLLINGQDIRKMIRNSINNIEQQLARIPYIMRIHRAFIVNLKMVASKKGNTLGYQLKINNTDTEIPVSRNNTKDFDRKMKLLR